MNRFKKVSQYFSVKNVSYTTLVLNLISFIFGVVYLAFETYNIIYDILGMIILISLFSNVFLVYFNTLKLNKTTNLGNRLNWFCYLYLVLMIIGMLFIGLGNMLVEINYERTFLGNPGGYGMLLIGYFSIFGLGGIISYLNIRNLNNRDLWDLSAKGSYVPSKQTRSAKKALKILLGFICFNILLIGIYFVFLLFLGDPMGIGPITESDLTFDFTQHMDLSWDLLPFGLALLNGVIGIVVAQFAVLFGISFLCASILLLKMINKKKHPMIYRSIGVLGLVITGINLAPLCLTPYYIATSEQSFAEAFGVNWKENIDPNAEQYFLPSQFSIPGYFLGMRQKDCGLATDILYFNGSISSYSQDKNITLKFDVYWPKSESSNLPGKNSTLIWIHGGGWMLGDKGNYRVTMNKYFAAQGYIVYDIQYGLIRIPFNVDAGILAADYKVGDFDINDQVRHIGNFCQYISNPLNPYSASKLGANLSSTFIHGGSAGGHLTCASTLAIWSNNYTNWFGSAITIKGYVPYYPGNGIPDTMMLDGDDNLINPEKMVNGTSPPCLIFHGTSDGLATPAISIRFKNAYTASNNKECAILWAPLGGHAADIFYAGYYNQVFTYYMERFLYLCVNDYIN